MLPQRDSPLILIVDDEPQARTMMSQAIRHRGYRTTMARNGEEALAAFAQLQPDLIVLDAMLPGIDGFEVCRRIQDNSEGSSPPILIVTALRDDLVIKRAFEAGASDYISKPFQWVELQQRMEQLLRARQAEKSLQETRERYEALFNRSLDAVYIHDFDGNFLDVNDAALDMLGYTHAEILQKNFLSLLSSQEHRSLAQQTFEEIRIKGYHEHIIEFDLKDCVGELIHVQVRGSLIYHEGRPWAIQGIARNITAHKQAQSALQESERRYALATKAAGVGVWDWNAQTGQFFLDPIIKGILGYSDFEIPNDLKAWMKHIHPQDRPKICEAAQTYLNGSSAEFVCEYRVFSKDGNLRWLLVRGMSIRDEHNHVLRMVGTNTDITDRKLAEKAQQQAETRLQQVIQTMMDGMLMIDQHGQITYANPAIERILDLPRESIVGQNYFDPLWQRVDGLQEPLDVDDLPLAIALNQQHQVKTGEYGILDDGNHLKWLSVNATPLFDDTGQLCGAVANFRDISERKNMEEALRDSEARYRGIIESNADAVVIVDREGIVHFINPAAEILFGRTADELIHQQFGFPVVLGETAEVEIISALTTDTAIAMNIAEMRVVETEWEGQMAYLASLRDITERKRAEEALRENEEQMRLIFEHAPIGMFTTDLDGRFMRVNPAFCKTIGRTATELLNMQYTDVTHADDIETNLALDRGLLLEQASHYHVEKRYIHHDRRIVYAILHRSLVRDDAGHPLHFIGQSVDISERKHVENVLRQSEERFRLLAENTRDLIALHEPDGTYVYISPSSNTVLGYEADELVGLHPYQFVHPDDLSHIQTSFKIGHGTSRTTYRFRKRSGSYIWFETQTQPIMEQDGVFVGLVTSSRDITERKLAEKRLRESERFARSTVDALSAHIAILDEVGTIIAVNKAWRNYVCPDAMMVSIEEGSNYLAVCDQSLGDNRLSKGIRSVIQGKVQQFTFDYDCENNGQKQWFTVRVTRFAGEGPVRVVISHENITPLKQAERAEHEQRGLAEALLDTATALSSTLELDEVLKRILINIERVLPHDMANIMLIEDGVAQIVGSRGYVPDVEVRLRSVRFIAAQNLTLQHMIDTKEPLIIPNIESSNPWPSLVPTDGARSYVSVPIVHSDDVMGILNLDSAVPEFFSQIDTERLQAFASQAAIAINNARAYEQAQELAMLEERQRLARELHDAVTQTIFSASLISEALPRLWDINPERVRASLPKMHRLIRGALAEMRSLLLELRPNALLETALHELLIQLGEALMGRTQMKCDVIIEGQFSLSSTKKLALYRIAQEAINNIFKHSRATEVFIYLNRSRQHIKLQIADNGRGFDPRNVSTGRLGLAIMEERATEIGATFAIESEPDQGTIITVTIQE